MAFAEPRTFCYTANMITGPAKQALWDRFPRLRHHGPRGVLRSVLAAALMILGAHPTIAEEAVIVKSREIPGSGHSTLLVRAFSQGKELSGLAGGASVELDRREVGPAPFSMSDIEPRMWRIGIMAPGFRETEISLQIETDCEYEIVFNLVRATGILKVTVDPADSQIIVDGVQVLAGAIVLPAGIHEISARRFGYLETSTTVTIEDRLTSGASLTLARASFEISEFRTNRTSFNPMNAGPYGRLRIGFKVSSWGTGELAIIDSDGRIVYASTWPSFSSWNQELIWDGRDGKGTVQPDGSYTLRLIARGASEAGDPGGPGTVIPRASGLSDPPLVKELTVMLDSRSIARPWGAHGGLPGLDHLPSTLAAPANLGMVDFGISYDFSRHLPFAEASAGYSAGNVDFGFSSRQGLAGDGGLVDPGVDLCFLRRIENGGDWSSGLEGSLGMAGDEADTLILRGGLSFPVGLALSGMEDGGTLLTQVGINPGLSLEWRRDSGTIDIEARLGAGVSLSTDSWVLGASFITSLEGLEKLAGMLGQSSFSAPSWSGVHLSLEGRLVPGGGPLVASATFGLMVVPTWEVNNPTLGLGLGIWF